MQRKLTANGGNVNLNVELETRKVIARRDEKPFQKMLDSGTGSRVHTSCGMVNDGKSVRSGELARLCGVSADTIRHYERIGILPPSPRTTSGYRMHGVETVQRVRLARSALQMGFSLAELSEILGVRDRGGVPCRRVFELAQEKLLSLQKQIAELRETEHSMQQMVRKWRVKLARTQSGCKAMLLHDLTTKPSKRHRAVNNLKRRRAS